MRAKIHPVLYSHMSMGTVTLKGCFSFIGKYYQVRCDLVLPTAHELALSSYSGGALKLVRHRRERSQRRQIQAISNMGMVKTTSALLLSS